MRLAQFVARVRLAGEESRRKIRKRSRDQLWTITAITVYWFWSIYYGAGIVLILYIHFFESLQ